MLSRQYGHPSAASAWHAARFSAAAWDGQEISTRRAPQIQEGSYPCSPFPSIGDQCFQIPGFFLMVPSPLQGTSHRMRSNRSWCCRLFTTLSFVPVGNTVCSDGILIAGKMDASWFVTMSEGEGSRAAWWINMCVRL